MGAIQNSMNRMLATIMGGAVGLKHVKEQEVSNNLKNEILENQKKETESAVKIAEAKVAESNTKAEEARAVAKANIEASKAKKVEAETQAEISKNKLANQERTELIDLARRQGEVKNETAELKKNISGIKGDLQYAKNQYDKLNNGPITTLEEADAYDKYGAEIPMRKKALRTANSALKSKQLEGKLIQTRISELTEKYPNALEGGKK